MSPSLSVPQAAEFLTQALLLPVTPFHKEFGPIQTLSSESQTVETSTPLSVDTAGPTMLDPDEGAVAAPHQLLGADSFPVAVCAKNVLLLAGSNAPS
jgi:hypothetical protein